MYEKKLFTHWVLCVSAACLHPVNKNFEGGIPKGESGVFVAEKLWKCGKFGFAKGFTSKVCFCNLLLVTLRN